MLWCKSRRWRRRYAKKSQSAVAITAKEERIAMAAIAPLGRPLRFPDVPLFRLPLGPTSTEVTVVGEPDRDVTIVVVIVSRDELVSPLLVIVADGVITVILA